MNKKIICFLLVACAGLLARSQSITGYEYWFDQDYENRTLVTLSASSVADINAPINTGSLSQGYHTFWFHTRDNGGKWSVPVSSNFVKGDDLISAYEYWFDMDYENRTLVNITGAELATINGSINTGSLAQGHHTLWFHIRDNGGAWSVPVSSSFVKGDNPVAGIEYWYDNDYTTRQYLDLTTAENISFNGGLPVSGLTVGSHVIAICMVDEQQERSVPLCTTFFYDGSVGVGDNLAGVSILNLFPNPSRSHVQLSGIGDFNQLVVCDQQGKTVIQQSVYNQTENINISELAPGTYTVLLVNSTHCATRTFMKE